MNQRNANLKRALGEMFSRYDHSKIGTEDLSNGVLSAVSEYIRDQFLDDAVHKRLARDAFSFGARIRRGSKLHSLGPEFEQNLADFFAAGLTTAGFAEGKGATGSLTRRITRMLRRPAPRPAAQRSLQRKIEGLTYEHLGGQLPDRQQVIEKICDEAESHALDSFTANQTVIEEVERLGQRHGLCFRRNDGPLIADGDEYKAIMHEFIETMVRKSIG